MDALAIRSTLDVWLHSGADWYEITGTARPPRADDPETRWAAIPLHLLNFAAAAIACGHDPAPRPRRGMPVLAVVSTSGVPIVELGAAEERMVKRANGGIVTAVPIPGSHSEEHPYFYIREALIQAATNREIERAATRNPTGLFRGNGGRTALVSESILAAGDRSAELVELHLTGQL
jgi:hypothetical protein